MPRKVKESAQQLQRRTVEIVARLRKKIPSPRTALNFSDPLELLVATILSAQATDVRTNEITAHLFRKYRTAADYANADAATLQEEIKASGFFRQKTKALMGVGRMLVEKFGGKVPETMEGLLELPGVARKTANVVLGSAMGKACGVVVDRHVARVATRLELTAKADPAKIEQDLMAIVPRDQWIDFGHLLVLHGRSICVARTPKCEQCVLNDICPSAFSFPSQKKKAR